MIRLIIKVALISCLLLILNSTVSAAPYFYITGPDKIYPNNAWQYSLYLYSDSTVVTAAQTEVHFDSTVIEPVSFNYSASVCKIWAPADPLLGHGVESTPYFKDGSKLVVSCGFPQGYLSGTGAGGLILRFNLTTKSGLSTAKSTSLTFANNKFLYIGNTITGGTPPSLSLIAYESTQSAYKAPTPTPTPVVSVDTLSDSELEFVNIASGSSRSRSTSTGSLNQAQMRELELQQEALANQTNQITSLDNNIPPPPPNLPKRAPVTPLPTPLTPDQKNQALGEVLSIQSLRELLLPGKSEADQKIVWINLLSTLTFICILAVLAWRLIVVSRMNKIKVRHMKELLTGELSVIESKLGNDNQIDEIEFSKSLEKLKQDLENS